MRPLALREPSFFTKGRKQVVPYLLRDVFREAEQLNVTLVWPKPDPVTMDLATRVAEPEPTNYGSAYVARHCRLRGRRWP